MRRWLWLIGLLWLAGCSTMQPLTVEDVQTLMQEHHGAGCLGGHVAGAGIGGARVAMTWGPDLSDDARRYCFGGP